MKLYFVPFACSLATRIAVVEAELDADFEQVVPGANATLADGRPFAAISPMGYVPALETPAGLTLSEGTAVLSYIADLAAENVLAPPLLSDARYRMGQWLNFVATELHKATVGALLSETLDDAQRAAIHARIPRAFTVLSDHLRGRDYLVDQFTVADAYLVSVLNWCETAGVPIADWPVLLDWRHSTRRRPSVAAAMAEEMPLLKAA